MADASVRDHSLASVAVDAPVAPPHPQVAAPEAASRVLSGSSRVTALGRR